MQAQFTDVEINKFSLILAKKLTNGKSNKFLLDIEDLILFIFNKSVHHLNFQNNPYNFF